MELNVLTLVMGIQNPKCWSIVKKLFVSSLIWLLSFGIYIGSSIYTPGTPGVMEEFGVSRVAATLGLTVFVAGYGVGSCWNWPGVV